MFLRSIILFCVDSQDFLLQPAGSGTARASCVGSKGEGEGEGEVVEVWLV